MADFRRDVGFADAQNFADFKITVPVEIKQLVQRFELLEKLVQSCQILRWRGQGRADRFEDVLIRLVSNRF